MIDNKQETHCFNCKKPIVEFVKYVFEDNIWKRFNNRFVFCSNPKCFCNIRPKAEGVDFATGKKFYFKQV